MSRPTRPHRLARYGFGVTDDGGARAADLLGPDGLGLWRPDVQEPDIHGHPARTAPHLVSFRDWIAQRAGKHPERRIVNATGAGILAGAGIVQRTAGHTLWRSSPLDRAAVHARVREAHSSTVGDPRRLFEAIAETTAEVGDLHRHLARWMDFTNSSVDARAILAALRTPELNAWTLGRAHTGAVQP